MNTSAKADRYIRDVLSGKTIACKWVKQACQRHVSDLQRTDGIYYDRTAANDAGDFIENLKHTSGEWAGSNLILEDWQAFIVAMIFGWKREDGTRRFRYAYNEVARKNGKTTLAAAIGLKTFVADGEPGAQVYTLATKYDQAKISHEEAKRMVKTSELAEYVTVMRNNLSIEATNSKFEPLGSDSKTQDGLSTHGAIIDELHAWPTRNLYDVIVTSISARRQPLITMITTAGYDKHSLCWEMHEYTEKVLEGIIKDDTHFGIIYTIDEVDKWDDERNWIKANPNLGISTKLDDLQSKAGKAKQIPSSMNSFKRLHLNIWTEAESRWISSEAWNACNTEKIDESSLAGRLCCSGLDLSSVGDLTALVHVFPPEDDAGIYTVLCRFWIPKDNIQRRVEKDRVPYDVWVRDGYIEPTPGATIDYTYILHRLGEDMNKYHIKDLSFDRYGAIKVIQDLQDMGFEKEDAKRAYQHRRLIDFGQGFVSMSPAAKELEKLILSKKINHGNNPVLTWMASNVVIKADPAGNIKPDKEKSTERIDGVVALVMAVDRAVRVKPQGDIQIW